jgi:hypothetical protein
MSIRKGSRRWWRITEEGTIERRTVRPEQPDPIAKHGERVWSRGIGPVDSSADRSYWQSSLRGVPKTAQHREKMRLAKLGKPKTEQQKARMRATHRARTAQIHAIQRELNCEWHEACKVLKVRKNAG